MSQRNSAVRPYIEDMQLTCRHIQQFIAGADESDFLGNVMMQYSVIRGIEVLGEAAKQLLDVLPDAAFRFPSIPLREMYATRNRLIHGYATIDLITVWKIVDKLIPSVRAAVEFALANWPADLL